MGPYFAPEPSMRRSRGGGVPPRAGPDPRAPREEALCSRSHSSPVFPMSSETSLRTAASRARWGGDSCPPLWVGLGRVFSDPASRRPALLSGVVCGPSVDLSLLPDVRCMIHRAPERGAVTGGQARAGAEERAREPGGAASARVGGAGRASSETRQREFSSSVFARLRSAVPKLHKRAARHEPSSPDLPKRPSGLGAGSPVLGFRFRRQGLCKSRGLRPARVTRAPTPWGGRAAPPRESLQFDCAPRSQPLADRF